MAEEDLSRRALFVSVEGLEGSGKSSVIRYLERYFQEQKRQVAVFREPGSTRIGERIREILLDPENREISPSTELLLYLAARTQLIDEKLRPALDEYDVVICDRFFDSTLAYQGYALGLREQAREGVRIFSLGMVPDITLLLDSGVEEGLARIPQKDRIESRSYQYHCKLREGYLLLARQHPDRIKVIDARGALEVIYPRVKDALEDFFLRRKKTGKCHDATDSAN
ncbi:MAG: dTMP kinase [Candidatus Omnitrophica bacterium]|nr:dTMP kinase [Candidatus Omnitrophota bacterium]